MISRGTLPQYVESETFRQELTNAFNQGDTNQCKSIIEESIEKYGVIQFTNEWIESLNSLLNSDLVANEKLLKVAAYKLLSKIISPPDYNLDWAVQIFNTYYAFAEDSVSISDKIVLLSEAKNQILKYGEKPFPDNHKEIFFKLSRIYYANKMYKDAESVIKSVLA